MDTAIPNFLLLSYPMINILVGIYQTLLFLHIPSTLGFSIIVLTVVIRLILYPLTAAQLKATKKMQDLNPHIKNLKEKHKGDAKMLQSETMRLYKEHGVNPAAGCLPVIVQLPLIFALYQVLNDVVKFNTTQINNVLYSFIPKLSRPWDLYFFGLPLAQSPSHVYQTLPIVLIIPLLTGLFQFIQSKMMLAAVPKMALVKKEEKKKDSDFATAFQQQSLYIFPFMIAFFSWGFPIGLSLYWNTFTIFGIIQQYKISGLGGLTEWIDKLNGKKN